MAGFTIGGKPMSQKKKNGFTISRNSKTANSIEYDGKNFGTVTDMGLKAIKTNTLDSYTPETEEEKKAIEALQNYLSEKSKEEEKNKKQPRLGNDTTDACHQLASAGTKPHHTEIGEQTASCCLEAYRARRR